MADLAATDVTVTVNVPHDIEKTFSGFMGDKWTKAQLSFGDGVKTYPAGGIPLPSPGYFKMNSQGPYPWMDIRQQVGLYEFVYNHTPTTNAPYGTIQMIVRSTGVELGHVAVPATNLYVRAVG